MLFCKESRIARSLVGLFAGVVLYFIPLCAADGVGNTFQTGVNEVRIIFAASDRQGHAIKSLHSSDVAVADNGSIIRHFRSFQSAVPGPLDLVLLLDASESVAKQLPAEIAEVASFVESSDWEERDSLSILVFGGMRPQLLCVRNCRASDVHRRLNALRADGTTPLYDALLQASEILQEHTDPEARPAMILFSDGMDTISANSLPDALLAAQELQAPIYALNSRAKRSSADRGDAVLDYLADNTGGLSFAPGQDLRMVLRTVLEDLRSGYVLTYQLPTPGRGGGGEHSVQILATRDANLRFRSRQSYQEGSGR
jgi:VWFA-related protein